MDNMVIGAQLFTLRDYLQNETDLACCLERVAAMGYTAVQLSGLGPIPPERIRALCDQNGLRIVLTHYGADRLLCDTEAVIRENELYGCRYIGLGGIPPRYCNEEWIDRFAVDFKSVARQIAGAGKRFLYHHHAFDFRRLGEKRQLEIILDAFPPEELGVILDTYWVQMAGADMFEWAQRLQDRIPCVHLKDMTVRPRVFDNIPMMMAVGEGNMNFKGFLALLRRLGKTEFLLAEQDVCPEDPFLCLEKSLRNLNAITAELSAEENA